MFHVELRQFPNVARSFNLSRQELDARIVGPWAAENKVELDDHRFSPEKAKLTIYEGPELRPEEMGLGRSWANVTRRGQDVTARVVEEAVGARGPGPASVQPLKLELLERATERQIDPGEVLALAAERHPGWRVSQQLALAEQAVWELLHQRQVTMTVGGADVGPERWEAILLEREMWIAADGGAVRFRAIADP